MNKTLSISSINHIAFVIDESGSMRSHTNAVIRVFDEQIKVLANRSVELNQETRVSLYTFGIFREDRATKISSPIRCVVYDKDVLRLPSLADHYAPDGGTPLCDATVIAMRDLDAQPELYADHAFLLYVITDGEENQSSPDGRRLLSQRLDRLKENWTVAALVPDHRGVDFCKRLGFHAGNILQWDASSTQGVEDAGAAMTQATQNYMTLRSMGTRSTKTLFKAQVTEKRTEVVRKLTPVSNPYMVLTLPTTAPRQAIKEFVEKRTKREYVIGSAYYQLVKTEIIQSNKRICLRTIPDGRLFSGSPDEVRAVLGLPAGGDIKVVPGEIKDFVVFIESTSVKRNVIPGQEILVMKL